MTWLILLFFPLMYEERVAAEAAYVIVTRQPEKPTGEKCCNCVGGKMLHGDGHVTDCPCPDTCECKRMKALLHPPVRLR
jgi:hypothetical protein